MVDIKKTPPMLGRRDKIAAAASIEQRSCKDCGATLPAHTATGRPPSYCEACKPRPVKVEGTLDYSNPGPGTAFRQEGDVVEVGEGGVIHGTPDPAYRTSEVELQSAMDDFVTARRDLAAAKAKLARLLEGA
jgi:hypothetical protein